MYDIDFFVCVCLYSLVSLVRNVLFFNSIMVFGLLCVCVWD